MGIKVLSNGEINPEINCVVASPTSLHFHFLLQCISLYRTVQDASSGHRVGSDTSSDERRA